jgi:SAM-dependent methyltransferase
LDVGCGFGYFSNWLSELGLEVTAVDGRRDNVAEASRRHPHVRFEVANVEDQLLTGVRTFDFVLCFGLLYHLENPFAAVRNLAAVSSNVLLIESVCAPGREVAAYMYEERQGLDQGINYIALIPTEAWLIKALYAAGFSFVYRTSRPPEHIDFRSRVGKKRRRIVLVASKREVISPLLVLAHEPRTRRYIWDSFGSLLESETLRARVRGGLKAFVGPKAKSDS